MTSTASDAELKGRHRAMWASGDYPAMVETFLLPLGPRLVEACGLGPGMRVLDIAAGTGNASIPAAQAGAHVTASDLTPELFDAARRRAGELGVEVEWVEGDAEDLPYDDGRFDRVASIFGVMFAPRHEVAARELARVTKPGGLIGLINWTPDGQVGQLFKIMGGYMPKPPEFASPPPLWGTEDHVRKLFEGTGVELEFERATTPWEFDSVEGSLSFMETNYGPTLMARRALGERWPECRAEIGALLERVNTATDGTLAYEAEYLLTLGRRVG